MKVIVVYASAGSGHRRAAEALYRCFRQNYPEVDAVCVDIAGYANAVFARLYSGGYAFLVTYLRFIWGAAYNLTRSEAVCRLFNLFCRLNCPWFADFITGQRPDVVLSTHFLPAAIVSRRYLQLA